MRGPQLLFVTGKGGTGKTTVAAALGAYLGRQKRRVLLVEQAGDRGLGHAFGKRSLGTEPTSLAPGVDGVRVVPQVLMEAYFARILRFRFLTRRLLSSITFNAVTAAAPGVTEFLLLDHLLQWLQPGSMGRRRYDLVVVDGPATGHALRLLSAPRQLLHMVPGGPLGAAAQRLLAMLTDRQRTRVLLVTIAEEMAINETIEARRAIADDLALQVARPVLNRVFPRRFSPSEVRLVDQLAAERGDDPLLAAARLQIRARRDVERHTGRLRRAFRVPPIGLRQVCADALSEGDLEHMGRVLSRGLKGLTR